jgi:hypothetical protein
VITSTFAQRQPYRLLLALGEADPDLPLDPGDRRLRVQRQPGRASSTQPDQSLGDALLGPVEAREEHARAILDRVGHHPAVAQLEVERCVNDLGRDLQQLGGKVARLVRRQAAMALVHGFGEGIADSGPSADHRRLLDPEPHRDLIGALEADAADVGGEAVRVLRDDLDRIGTVGLEDPHRPRRADAMAVQEQHDLADHHLLSPATADSLGTLRPDPVHLPQALGALLDRVEHALGERLDQLLGVDGPDALDHAGAQVALDALERGRRGGAQEGSLELEPVGPVVHP